MAAADVPRALDTMDGAVWVGREHLEGEALSSLARKLVRHAMAATQTRAIRHRRRT